MPGKAGQASRSLSQGGVPFGAPMSASDAVESYIDVPFVDEETEEHVES
jgi:hypothetical protein